MFLFQVKGPSIKDESKVGYISLLCYILPVGPIHQKKKKEKRAAYVRLSLVFCPWETAWERCGGGERGLQC